MMRESVLLLHFLLLGATDLWTAEAAIATSDTVISSRRIDTAVAAESALIDKETGRIYWEGGSQTTLSATLGPTLAQFGIQHVKATLLSLLLVFAVVGVLLSWLRHKVETSLLFQSDHRRVYISIVYHLLQWTILRTPRLPPKLVTAIVLLYFLEAFQCSTRTYLANAICSPEEVERYIENLRSQDPKIQWTVRSFHYEPFYTALLRIFQRQRKSTSEIHCDATEGTTSFSNFTGPNTDTDENIRESRRKGPTLDSNHWWARKLITHNATGTYNYQQVTDLTTAGVWRRAPASPIARFSKLILSKHVVLLDGKTRGDYLSQQADFATKHGQEDRMAEYATNLAVEGFQSRVLAVRANSNDLTGEGCWWTTRFFQSHMFWLATAFGLTVPYRYWFARHCDEIRIRVVKEISAAPVPAPSWSWFGPSKNNVADSKTCRTSKMGNGDSDENYRSLMQTLRLYGTTSVKDMKPSSTTKLVEPTKISGENNNLTVAELQREVDDAKEAASLFSDLLASDTETASEALHEEAAPPGGTKDNSVSEKDASSITLAEDLSASSTNTTTTSKKDQ